MTYQNCETENSPGAPLGNQNNLRHGGAGALKRVQAGQPFVGLAAQKKREISERLADEGALQLLEETAEDFLTVAQLYRDAVFTALDAGDNDQATAYIKTWGWINGHALRALEAVVKSRQNSGGAISPTDVLEAMR